MLFDYYATWIYSFSLTGTNVLHNMFKNLLIEKYSLLYTFDYLNLLAEISESFGIWILIVFLLNWAITISSFIQQINKLTPSYKTNLSTMLKYNVFFKNL